MSTGAWSANEQDGRRNSQSSNQVARNEAEENLDRLFMEGVGDKLEEITYKPTTGGSTKAGNWANKSSKEMANGKDFFAELRKQVSSLMEKEKAGG